MFKSEVEFCKRNTCRNYIIISGIFLLLFGILREINAEIKRNEYALVALPTFGTQFNVGEDFPETKYIVNSTGNFKKNMFRRKRFVIFNGGGVVKLVLGVSFPVQLADRVRSLNCFYNLQLQYAPPPRPLYLWSLFNTSTFPGTLRKLRPNTPQHDLSRQFIYTAIENAFNRAGLPGKQCILKSICEIARLPFYVPREGASLTNWSIYHELLNAIFTLKYLNVDFKYMHAYHTGINGGICNNKCPTINNWLERSSIYL